MLTPPDTEQADVHNFVNASDGVSPDVARNVSCELATVQELEWLLGTNGAADLNRHTSLFCWTTAWQPHAVWVVVPDAEWVQQSVGEPAWMVSTSIASSPPLIGLRYDFSVREQAPTVYNVVDISDTQRPPPFLSTQGGTITIGGAQLTANVTLQRLDIRSAWESKPVVLSRMPLACVKANAGNVACSYGRVAGAWFGIVVYKDRIATSYHPLESMRLDTPPPSVTGVMPTALPVQGGHIVITGASFGDRSSRHPLRPSASSTFDHNINSPRLSVRARCISQRYSLDVGPPVPSSHCRHTRLHRAVLDG